MIRKQSLLDLLSIQMGCACLADLQSLSCAQRRELAQRLEKLVPCEEDQQDWNAALEHLTNAPREKTARAAKERLVYLLSTANTEGTE